MNRKLSALASFYEFHHPNGVAVDDFLTGGGAVDTFTVVQSPPVGRVVRGRVLSFARRILA